jgi:hypothetical protein
MSTKTPSWPVVSPSTCWAPPATHTRPDVRRVRLDRRSDLSRPSGGTARDHRPRRTDPGGPRGTAVRGGLTSTGEHRVAAATDRPAAPVLGHAVPDPMHEVPIPSGAHRQTVGSSTSRPQRRVLSCHSRLAAAGSERDRWTGPGAFLEVATADLGHRRRGRQINVGVAALASGLDWRAWKGGGRSRTRRWLRGLICCGRTPG